MRYTGGNFIEITIRVHSLLYINPFIIRYDYQLRVYPIRLLRSPKKEAGHL